VSRLDPYGADTSCSERRFKMIATSTTTNTTTASSSPATFAGSSDGFIEAGARVRDPEQVGAGSSVDWPPTASVAVQ